MSEETTLENARSPNAAIYAVIPTELAARFKTACAAQSVTQRDVITALIEYWLHQSARKLGQDEQPLPALLRKQAE